MSKELEALKEIENHKIKYDVNIKYDNGEETQRRFETIKDMFPNQFALIETALKNYEKQHQIDIDLLGTANKTNVQNQKKLKALDFIKETLPIDEEDFFFDKETNKYFFIGREVSKDRFDLLKEVLL